MQEIFLLSLRLCGTKSGIIQQSEIIHTSVILHLLIKAVPWVKGDFCPFLFHERKSSVSSERWRRDRERQGRRDSQMRDGGGGQCATAAAGDVQASKAVEFVISKVDDLMNWARRGSIWPMTFGLALLRRRDDARRRVPLRLRPLRRHLPPIPATVRLHDRRRDAHQQAGARAPQVSTTFLPSAAQISRSCVPIWEFGVAQLLDLGNYLARVKKTQ